MAMALHICSNCGHAEHIFGAGGGERMEPIRERAKAVFATADTARLIDAMGGLREGPTRAGSRKRGRREAP